MIFRLEVLPFAQADIQEAFSYYEEISPELAEDLLTHIDLAFDKILEHPLQHQVVFEDARKINTQRFLYGVYYFIDNDLIKIFAVVHLKRNPSGWKERLEKP